MAGHDGSINIDTRINNDDFYKGVKEIKSAIDSLHDTVKDIANRINATANDCISKISSDMVSITNSTDEASTSMSGFSESVDKSSEGVEGIGQGMEGVQQSAEQAKESLGDMVRLAREAAERSNSNNAQGTRIPAYTVDEIESRISEFQEAANTFFTATDEFENSIAESKRSISVSAMGYAQAMRDNAVATQEFDAKLNELKQQAAELEIQFSNLKGIKLITGFEPEGFNEAKQLLDDVKRKIDELNQKRIRPIFTQEWDKMPTLTNQIAEGLAKIQYKGQMAMYAIQHPLQAINRGLAAAIPAALRFAKSFAGSAIKGAKNVLISTAKSIKEIGTKALRAAANLAKMAGSNAISFLKKLAEGAKNAAIQLAKIAGNAVVTGIKKIGSAVTGLASKIFNLNKGASGSGISFRQAFNSFIRYGIGVRSLFALVNKLRSAFTEAMGNMATQVPSVNAALSALASSLAMLKNSLATAFQPIVTAVAPYLTKFMDMLSQALTKVGEFFAVLTGQKFVYKAKKPDIDYKKTTDAYKEQEKQQKKDAADALKEQKEQIKAQNEAAKEEADAQKKAIKDEQKKAKAMEETTKEAENQLAAFDHLNILEDTSKDDKKTSGDGDNGLSDLYGIDPDDIKADLKDLPSGSDFAEYFDPTVEFEKIPIENAISDFAKRIKDAFEKGDFYGIGKQFADSINNLVGGIDWDGLGTKVGKGINAIVDVYNGLMDNIHWQEIGQSLAKFANSLIEEVDWENLGRALTQHIDALFKMLLGFVKEFDFSAAGKAFADLLWGMFDGIDWNVVGEALGRSITGLADFVYNAAISFPWAEAGKKLASGANKLVENLDTKKIADALIALIKGALAGMQSFIETFNWSELGEKLKTGILELVNEFPADEAATALTGLVKGLLDVILPTISDEAFWAGLGTKFSEFVNGIFTDEEMWDKIETAIEGLVNGVITALKTFVENFQWGKTGEIFKNEFQKLITNIDVDALGDMLTSLVKGLLDLILPTISDQTTWTTIGNKLSALLNKLFTDTEMWSKIGEAAEKAINGIITTIHTTIKGFKWGEAGTTFKDTFKTLITNINTNEIGDTVADLVKGAIAFAMPLLADDSFISTMAGKLAQFFDGLFSNDDLGDVVGTFANNLLTGVLSFGQSFFDEIQRNGTDKKAAASIKTFFSQIDWADIAAKTWNLLKSAFQTAGNIIDILLSDDNHHVDTAAVGTANSEKIAESLSGGGSLGAKLGSKIAQAISSIPWKDFAELLSTGAESLFRNFADAMNSLGNRIEKGEGKGRTVLANAVIEFFSGIKWGDVASAIVDAAWETFKTLGKTLFDWVVAGFTGKDPEGYLEDKTGFGDALTEFANNTASDPTLIESYDNVGGALVDATTTGYKKKLGAGRKDILEATDKAFELPDPSTFESEGKKPAEGITNGYIIELAPHEKEIKDTTQTSFVDAAKEPIENCDWITLGGTPIENTETGMENAAPSAKQTSAETFGDIVSAGEDKIKDADFIELGSSMPEDTEIGADRAGSSAARSVGSTFDDIADAAESIKDRDWSGVGEAIVDGTERGVNNNRSTLIDSLTSLASDALEAAKNFFGIHSPSRVFRDEVGAMIGAGLAVGIIESEDEVVGSISDLSSATVNAADSMVNDIGKIEIPAEIATNVLTDNEAMDKVDRVLSSFSDKVEYSFSSLMDKLQAIADRVNFQIPDIAKGMVLPYAVEGRSADAMDKLSETIYKSNEDLIDAIIQIVNNQTSAIIEGLERYGGSGGGSTMSKEKLADTVIGVINTRTRSKGKSPLLI